MDTLTHAAASVKPTVPALRAGFHPSLVNVLMGAPEFRRLAVAEAEAPAVDDDAYGPEHDA